ncbi:MULTISPECIES: cysteine--tRNA ligase [Glutamicibacter]|uniref:Cysteine--tRNA ligase n=1 Tax=Glutamicibacter halophytocola TaxID=1933880 RepID=A0A5B8IYX2_9MICC|nr:cysteine--tRNA ligase [Glutamicibacter halophytocola]MBF6671818.1 cysteine--tRNA ligase [Glutamicibacter sp. FBE19]ALG28026.1 cysteinyl-tRNA synthetase [Glutamicibacter halophytocola]NQD40584.1 cysteine--tRNA ligase [Glutamicibacter halophytocola]QDY67367.1 cysteine--tRNA ligase [Glutamicibacter halophytocola]UUX59547.1 cysteine--tRNA ligase [Glutamicibacter halophytocola]
MSLRFYDTKTASVRDFQPLAEGEVKLYYCGATVQGMPHVGHVRSAIVFDVLVRWLEYRGFAVTTVRNVTDIDDKILEKSANSFTADFEADKHYKPREEWFALAYRFEQEFARAYEALGVRRPTYEPRATGHITEMHELISELIERGHAYPAADGSGDVYFDVRSYEQYGALTRQKIEDMQDAADSDPRGKKDARDFALWKGHKESDPGTASWPSPWGRGRPGWHLECSAMAGKYLGSEFDIHGGGLDLRFPHHENEMAQSNAAGHGFANFWMHNGMVTYEGEKMSKSIGNTISPEEMLALADARVVRYFLGQAQYRSMLDYRPDSLTEAGAAVERIDTFISNARYRLGAAADSIVATQVPEAFASAMDDDLNVPMALAALHETVRHGNASLDKHDDAATATALGQVLAMTRVLGLDDAGNQQNSKATAEHDVLDQLIQAQLAERAQARAAKDWARSDAIRDALAAAGITVLDSADGARWTLNN